MPTALLERNSDPHESETEKGHVGSSAAPSHNAFSEAVCEHTNIQQVLLHVDLTIMT